MTKEELKQSEEAIDYVKKNGGVFIDKFAGKNFYTPDQRPVSLFMAGSPGAGKTEISKRLIEKFRSKPVRIDADEIREMMPGYDGFNSYVFQAAASKGVNILYDYVLHSNLNVIMDGIAAGKLRYTIFIRILKLPGNIPQGEKKSNIDMFQGRCL